MAAVEIAALREQRSEIVVGFGEIGLQRERALERGPRPSRLAAPREQRAQAIQRRRARVRLRGALERGHRGSLESLIEKLPAVRQVVAQRQRRNRTFPETARARASRSAGETSIAAASFTICVDVRRDRGRPSRRCRSASRSRHVGRRRSCRFMNRCRLRIA